MTEYHRTSAWIGFAKKARPLIAARLPLPCVNAGSHPTCTGTVTAGDRWDVAHLPGHDAVLTRRIPSLAEVGPAHAKCNRRAGALLGAKRRRVEKSRETRMFPW